MTTRRARTGGRRRWLVPLAMLAGLLAGGAPARAVIVYEKGNRGPIRGYLVQQSEASITVEIRSAAGVVLDERIITRSAIEDLIITVDNERLAALRRTSRVSIGTMPRNWPRSGRIRKLEIRRFVCT